MDLNQAAFMRKFNEENREQFNPQFFERKNEDIIEAVSKIIYSCERDKYFTLKVLSITPIMDYEDIYNALRQHVEDRRKKGDKTVNPYDLIDIKASKIMLLKVRYFIRHNGNEKQKIDGKMVDVLNAEDILEVLIALPRFTKKYYFYLNGNYYNATNQIVDGSTYNNSSARNNKADSVTMKTMFQPIRILRIFRDLIDCNTNETDTNILYTSIIFNNHLNCMYYILAAYGFQYTKQFLGIYTIEVSQFPIVLDGWSCYNKHNIFIAIPKNCQDPMVQSLAVTIYDAVNKDTNINDLYNQRFWLLNLGIAFKNASVEKGLFILDSIEYTYDQITKEQLKLPPEYKENVYMLLRWLMREFPALRAKDNVDVSTKKMCIADYIARIYATKLSTGIHRISDMGKRVTLKSVIRAIYTTPMYVINTIICMSNLVDYVDMVNDNDATTALKFTYKGIAGLGEDGAAVQDVYRYVDPSHIGILDLDVSSTSDPGMSGMICPMANVYNGFFSEYQEPNNWEAQYGQIQKNYMHDLNPNAKPAIQYFGPPPVYNPVAERERLVTEVLELDRKRCPIYSLTDPTKDYTTINAKRDEEPKEVVRSLFTIRKDDE